MGIAHLAQGEREKLLTWMLNTSQNHVPKDELEKNMQLNCENIFQKMLWVLKFTQKLKFTRLEE